MLSCHDEILLDRWIPDEDWVRQIRENGERDCSIANFNRGMSAQCCWQNNRVTLQGETIFYNKKNIQTRKTKAIASKPIRFYYVLSAGKPAPSVPSDQSFYQSLWSHPDRRNRLIKRKAKRATPTPPTKKAKASSAAVTSPRTFNAALHMLLTVWQTAYGATLNFPTELLASFPMETATSVSGMNIHFKNNKADSTHTTKTNSQ